MSVKFFESVSPLPPLSVAKWLKLFVLIDADEMQDLFHFLNSPFSFFDVHGITKKGEGVFSPDVFLQVYREYVNLLKRGEIPSEKYQREFTRGLSRSYDAFYALKVEGERQLLKPLHPIIQVQLNRVRYSSDDHSFRCQVYGQDSFSWGLQIAYPQIYQDPKTHEILATDQFLNGPLFKSIQKWVREATRPTPFLIEGKKQNEPIRLGKKCFGWINNHAELKLQNISVHVS